MPLPWFASRPVSIAREGPVELVDTSVWVEVFRRGSRITLDEVVGQRDEVVTCLPVLQEVLLGFDDERAFAVAKLAFEAIPCLDSPKHLDPHARINEFHEASGRDRH